MCVCVCARVRVLTLSSLFPFEGAFSWRCWGGVWGQQMHASTVPEASKLPVILLVMQRSAHSRRESELRRR